MCQVLPRSRSPRAAVTEVSKGGKCGSLKPLPGAGEKLWGTPRSQNQCDWFAYIIYSSRQWPPNVFDIHSPLEKN